MTSKDEMPEQVFLYKNGEHFEVLEFTPAPTHRDWTLYTRKDLSPPVPDDVAASALVWFDFIMKCCPEKILECEPSRTIRKALRAASTPSAEVRGLREALEWTCKRITYLEDTIGGRHVRGIPASVDQALNQPMKTGDTP